MQEKNKNIFATIGGRLQYLREKLGLSQSELAKNLNFVSPAVISRFERNERFPGVESLLILAKLYKIDLHWLITGQPSPDMVSLAEILKPFAEQRLSQLAEGIKTMERKLMGLDLKQSLNGENHFQEIQELQTECDTLKAEYDALGKNMLRALSCYGKRNVR